MSGAKMECVPVAMVMVSVLLLLVDIREVKAGEGTFISDLTERILNESTYNRRVRPGADTGDVTTVTLNMFVNSISSINEARMEYSINLYFRQVWLDQRLAFSDHNETVTLEYSQFSRLWVPDLFFRNEKESRFHDITVPNRLLTVSPDGTVLYSQRLSLTLSCNMHLANYPMDNQTCPIEMETYAHTTRELVFEWRDSAAIQTTDPKPVLPEFEWYDSELGDCTMEYITGAFSCKFVHIRLRRVLAHYMIQIYIPSILVVMLSWVSFWIDVNAVPARISVGLLTVLAITTMSTGYSSSLPRVSYIKAIDIWMTTCLGFVFGALVEYAVVNVLARKNKEKRKLLHKKYDMDNELKKVEDGSNALVAVTNRKQTWWYRVTHEAEFLVDNISRVTFPLIYSIFVATYFSLYIPQRPA